MSPSLWLRSPRLRRGVALSAVVLATGGLVLVKTPASAFPNDPRPALRDLEGARNAVRLSGPGAHGVVALSHARLVPGRDARVFAEIRLSADPDEAKTRAPLSLAVVVDTSGSMDGEKLEEAKRSVLRMTEDMRDDDEIALVRYADASEVVQPLARLGTVRSELAARVRELRASGGTNIPGGLAQAVRSIGEASRGRVRRVVLVSDGLDATRARAESLARQAFGDGVAVSALGIGLDFDEGYMAAVARSGHGNFAFVEDGAALGRFLRRELEETAKTTIEDARVRLRLPSGMRFVSATGADARASDGDVELALGSLFAGDERRVIVELAARIDDTASPLGVDVSASWARVGGRAVRAEGARLLLAAAADSDDERRAMDGAVLASATSAVSSWRQVEAAEAYAKGDVARAAHISEENERELSSALAAAPAPAASSLQAQLGAYREMRRGFTAVAPSSAAGRAAAKSAAAAESRNLARKEW